MSERKEPERQAAVDRNRTQFRATRPVIVAVFVVLAILVEVERIHFHGVVTGSMFWKGYLIIVSVAGVLLGLYAYAKDARRD